MPVPSRDDRLTRDDSGGSCSLPSLVFWLAVLALAITVVIVGVSAVYFADLFSRTKRRRVEGSPADLGLRYEDVAFSAPDGVALRGWYLESPGARASIVLLHDVEGTRSDMSQGLLNLQGDYVRRGFHVLAFDLRGRGESSGGRDHFGGVESRDVVAAVGLARSRSPGLPILLHGFGLGGSLAIVAAAEGVPVDGIIADSPFASARDYLRHRWAHVPQPLFHLAGVVARQLFHADMRAFEPLMAARSLNGTRVLFIHGQDDHDVPVSHTLNLAAASINADDEIWLVPDAGHCAVYASSPQTYMRRCLAFIDRIVPARQPVASAG